MYTILVNGLPKCSIACRLTNTTWSYISAGSKLRTRFIFPVAQKVQLKLQPTCDDTQTVNRLSFGTGIKTDSIKCPSCSLNLVFIVPSELCCTLSTWMALITNSCSSFVRKDFDKLVISEKVCAPFCHSHSYTCLARNFCSPCSTNQAIKSSLDQSRISFFIAILRTSWVIAAVTS